MKTAVKGGKSNRGDTFTFPNTIRLFDNVFDFFGTLDCEGKVLQLFGRIFETTNTDPNLLAGQPFSQTVFWQSSSQTPKIFEKSFQNAAAGKQARLVLDFRLSADEKIPMEVNLQPFTLESGENVVFVSGRLVTAKSEQLEHNKEQSEQLLFAAENAEIGLWYWDFSKDRIYSTPRCNELFQVPAYELLTYERIRGVIHPEDREFVDGFLEQSRINGTRYEEEFRVVYADGTIEWLCAEGRSFLNDAGEPQKMMGVVRNITKQKLASVELERVHERERRARDEAVEANRAKDFFLAFVSHELRSPLNAILGWSKILLTKPVDDETRKNALETIERSARFQTKLINDLVDSARVASGKLRLEYRPTNLYEIVRNSYQAQKPSADARNLTFTFTSTTEEIPVFGDAGRLQQVFSNLISNAIKFTPDGGKVAIDVEIDGASAIVGVTDTGYGINPSALPNIFRQFSQGDVDQTKNSAGLGLGLSIVQILVTKHGGFVTAESEGVGKGSRFTVTLPIRRDEQIVPEVVEVSDTSQKRSLEGLKILVVEDDLDSREVLQLFLQHSGAIVTSAESAKAALNALTRPGSQKPDVIISDLAMPDEDGYSFMARVRQLSEEKGGRVPALALSAFATVESRKKAFEAGFNKYSTKPFEPDLLIKEISDLAEDTADSQSTNGVHQTN